VCFRIDELRKCNCTRPQTPAFATRLPGGPFRTSSGRLGRPSPLLRSLSMHSYFAWCLRPSEPLYLLLVLDPQLAAARSLPPTTLHLASPKTSVMCWSRKGVPGLKRKRRGGDPLPRASCRARFPKASGQQPVRLGGRSGPTPLTTPQPGCPVHIRTANRTPDKNTKGASDDSSTVSGGPRIIAPAPAVQRSTWEGAEGCTGRRSAPSPIGRLVRQPPFGGVRRRRRALEVVEPVAPATDVRPSAEVPWVTD